MAEKGLRERKIMGGGGLGGKENRERESYEKMGKRLRGESGFWGGRGQNIEPTFNLLVA